MNRLIRELIVTCVHCEKEERIIIEDVKIPENYNLKCDILFFDRKKQNSKKISKNIDQIWYIEYFST